MKKVIILALLCIVVTGKVFSQFSATLAGYPLVTTGWNIGGDAVVVDSSVRLTPATGTQSGYVYYNTPVNLTTCGIFTVDFDYKIVASTGLVADGIAFWYISNPPSGFATGGGIGLPSYPNGLIMIMDTYNNDAIANNPLETLLGYNGTISGYTEGSAAGVLCPVSGPHTYIDDGTWHHCKITYFSGTINVYFNYSTTPSQTGTYPMAINGYFGFSSSTGAAYSTQSVKSVYITAALPTAPTVPDSVVSYCQGAIADTLLADTVSGETLHWFTTDTAISVSLPGSPTPTTTAVGSTWYYVRQSVGTCISAADSIRVVVNPVPAPPVLAYNAPVCTGSALDFTATEALAGGTYSWSGPNGYTSTLENPVINPATLIDSGIYKTYVTVNGCIDSASIDIVIDSTPGVPVASSNSAICSDSTLLLTATDPTSGVSYSWVGPNGFVSTLQNPIITNVAVAASGTYTVTSILGICRDSSTTVVQVNPTPPLPSFIATLPLCSGTALNLTANVDTAGATYYWTGPQGFTSTLQNPTINPADTAATGLYTLVATLNGCPSQWASEAVLVDSTPAPLTVTNPITICQYGTIYFTANTITPGVSYSWSGPLSFTSTLADPIITDANTDALGLYRVIAGRGFCADTTEVVVTIDSIPLLKSAGSNAPVCSGGNLQLNSFFTPTGGTYNWFGPNGFTSIMPDPPINPVSTLASGTYSVSETLDGCTSDTVTVSVVIHSTPSAPNIFSNSPICQGDSIYLISSDDTAGVAYSWSGPNGFISTLQNPFITNATIADSGLYQVIATLGMCKDSSDTIVSITRLPTITPTHNGPLCTGTLDTLFLYGNAQAGSTYSWSGPYNFASSAPNPFVTDITTENAGIYEVTALLNNCYAHAYDTVVINQTPLPPFITWLTYCQYYPAPQLQANDTGVKWYPADTLFNPLPVPPTPSTLLVGSTFYFTALTVNGCTSVMDSVLVTVNPTPTVTVTPADTAVCPHSSYVLTAVDTDVITYYQWSPDIYLSGTTTESVIVTPETSQSYTVVASNKYGCADTATANVVVHPAALIYLGDSVTLYPGEAYTMSPSTNCTSFNWFPPAGLSNSEMPNPVASPAVSTKYIVYGQTEDGCTTSDSISIYVSANSLIDLPNAFTPGNGPNSQFKLIKKGVVSLDYFRIFNRWGQKVFETTNVDAGWDGTFNGTPQPFDVYVYEVQAISSSGQSFVVHGNLTLLR